MTKKKSKKCRSCLMLYCLFCERMHCERHCKNPATVAAKKETRRILGL